MKSKLVFFFALLLILPLVSGSSFYIPQNTNYSIKFNCEIDGAVCTDTATCNVSIDYPNTSVMIDNQAATLISNARYNYTLESPNSSIVGEDYTLTMVCYDGQVNGSQSLTYGVNPSGIRPSEQRTATLTRSIYFIFIIGILLFLAFLFTSKSPPAKWTFFAFSVVFFLMGINIIFVSLQDEIVNPKLSTFFSSFTTISWIFYWFIGGLLIIMWALTFLNTWILKKNQDAARRYGLG